MALGDLNITAGGKSSSTLWSLTAVPPGVPKENQMADVWNTPDVYCISGSGFLYG